MGTCQDHPAGKERARQIAHEEGFEGSNGSLEAERDEPRQGKAKVVSINESDVAEVTLLVENHGQPSGTPC